MQLKLFAFNPSFERERRVLVAQPAAARFSRKLSNDAAPAQVPPVLTRRPGAAANDSARDRGTTALLDRLRIDKNRADDLAATPRADQLAAQLIARKEHGLYGATHPFVQQLWRARGALEEH